MNENPDCQLCELNETCKSVCLKGEYGDDVKLMIFLNYPQIVEDRRGKPMVSEEAELLRWLIKRMSVPLANVGVDFVLKCYTKGSKSFSKKAERMKMIEACFRYRIATLQHFRPKAVVVMGATACEAFLGSEKVASFEGTKWNPKEPKVREFIDKVWVTYAPGYALKSPAECVTLYRTLFAAAEEAGLQPKLNKELIHYDFGF